MLAPLRTIAKREKAEADVVVWPNEIRLGEGPTLTAGKPTTRSKLLAVGCAKSPSQQTQAAPSGLLKKNGWKPAS